VIAVRYAKYRLPGGCHVQRKIGPAWTGRECPADGYFTSRAAQAWLSVCCSRSALGLYRA